MKKKTMQQRKLDLPEAPKLTERQLSEWLLSKIQGGGGAAPPDGDPFFSW